MSALEFTSDYQYLVPSASPGLDAPNWTINVWVYPTSTANGRTTHSTLNADRFCEFQRQKDTKPNP